MKIKSQQQILQRIRNAEHELTYATPARAAKLTSEIVRLKSTVFDKQR